MNRMKVLNVVVAVLVGTACASAEHTTVDLRAYFDNDGISYATKLADGDFNFQCSYPAEEMPSPVKADCIAWTSEHGPLGHVA